MELSLAEAVALYNPSPVIAPFTCNYPQVKNLDVS